MSFKTSHTTGAIQPKPLTNAQKRAQSIDSLQPKAKATKSRLPVPGEKGGLVMVKHIDTINARIATLLALLTGILSMAVPAAASAAECPNEAIRREQNATALPDCRAYERVSPEEKGNGDIVADGETTVASEDGEGVAFSSRSQFGDTVGSAAAGQTQYVARRGPEGWASHAVTPMAKPESFQTFLTPTLVQIFSSDLRSAVVQGYDLPGALESTPYRNNIYVEDTATRKLQGITVSQTSQPLSFFDFVGEQTDHGTSADAQHVAFVASSQLLEDAAPGVPNVYQWDAGKGLSLAGILPDNTVPSEGSTTLAQYRGSMSTDGKRLVFSAAPNGSPQLYMRIEGAKTVWISKPQGSDQSEPAEVSLKAVTPDGRNVFFTTSAALLDSDTNGAPDLYRWTDNGDPEHTGTLTLIPNVGAGQESGVIGVSNDGAIVYYATQGDTVGVWDNGVSEVIHTAVSTPPAVHDPDFRLSVTAYAPGAGRVTPDGKWLAFLSRGDQANNLEALTGQVTHEHTEMYVYSLAAKTLTCVSCGSAANGDASVRPDATEGDPQQWNSTFRPHFLSDSGQVFFSTTEALLPQDVNGVEDVYEYDAPTGTLRLLSRGTGADPTSFADASADGSNVFLATRGQMLRSDQDNLVDLYDVRMGGGYAEPLAAPAPPCAGDECQGGPGGPPGAAPPGSLSYSGSGDVTPAPPAKPAVNPGNRGKLLARALRQCRRIHSRSRRQHCEKLARRHYGHNAVHVRRSK